ncbi:MAG: TonB-dependent receptor plug domain-containing protein, partial [Opitutus sp.]
MPTLVIVIALFFSGGSAIAADPPGPRDFDIAAGKAPETLTKFAEQADREIIYSTELLAKVTTPALKGRVSPRDALEQLVAHAGLTAVEDGQTGMLMIMPAPKVDRPGGAEDFISTATDAKEENQTTMKPKNPIALLGNLLALVLAPAVVAAQPPEEAIVLSPFEVSAERDTGFVAAASLAGGRLASELRDTPVAYSVITRDFIDALNITDLQMAADWTTGTTYEHDIETPMAFGQDVNYSTRGSGPGAQQRNFFPQRNKIDSYNLERFDFGRGPNAILFGNGSLGGVSSATTKRARTDSQFSTIEFGVGSWDHYRGTLDVNQPLGDKFAVRLAGVLQDSDGWRLKEFDRRKAAFLTATLKPIRNMEIRLEGEYATNTANKGFTTISEKFAGWNGTTTYNAPQPLRSLPSNSAAL